MRELLRTNDRRRLGLIELMLEASDWITYEEIAKQLNCSVRVLKEDVTYFRQNSAEFEIEASHEGIRLFTSGGSGIKDYYRKTLKESLPFQILELIFFDETLMINDLAEHFHSSPATIYRVINQIHDYFSENHQAYIRTNPCRFEGNEAFIRNFYRAYFSEAYTILEWPFKPIDEAGVNENFNRVLSLLAKDIEIDFAYYEAIKITVMVNLIRYNHKHLIETAGHESALFKILFTVFKSFIIPKGSQRLPNSEISTEFIYQVYHPYIQTGIAYNKKQFHKIRRKNTDLSKALSFLESRLSDLSKHIDIPINMEDVLFSISGTSSIEDDDINSQYILFNRNKFFVQALRRRYPDLSKQLLEAVTGYRTLLNKAINEDKNNLLIYTLFTYWDNLLTELYRKYQNVSLLVLSDAHYSHAVMIQNLLKNELPSNVNIDVYKAQQLSLEMINQLDYDLIVSTFSLSEQTNAEVIVINPFPTNNDSIRIKQSINQIILHNKNSFSLLGSSIQTTKKAAND